MNQVDEEGSYVIDHLNFDAARDSGHHTMVVADSANLIKSDKISGGVKAPLLYHGAGKRYNIKKIGPCDA